MKKEHLFIVLVTIIALLVFLEFIYFIYHIVRWFNVLDFFRLLSELLFDISFVFLILILFKKRINKYLIPYLAVISLAVVFSLIFSIIFITRYSSYLYFSDYMWALNPLVFRTGFLVIAIYYFQFFQLNRSKKINLAEIQKAKEQLDNNLISKEEYDNLVKKYIQQNN